MAAALGDGQIVIWDLDRSQPRLSFQPDAGRMTTAMTFAGSSERLLTVGPDLALWDTSTGSCLLRAPLNTPLADIVFHHASQTVIHTAEDSLMALPSR